MKKSKLTIAVLSACMLAATGGISLGAAALANAPEAIKAPESSLVAEQAISEGIKVKREVSQDGNAITLTYSITPSYASNTNISASLAWNAANPNNRVIGNFLTMTHNASTKTIVVTKTADFDVQAKVTITDSVSNATATVVIDCVQRITNVQIGTVEKGTISVSDLDDDGENNYGGQIVIENDGQWFGLSQCYTVAADPKVDSWAINYKTYYSDSPTFSQSQLPQSWENGNESHMFLFETYNDVNDQDRAENVHTDYGLGRLWLGDEVGYGRQNKRYQHIYAEVKATITYNAVISNGTDIDDCVEYYAEFFAHWCIDFAAIMQSSAITPEVGHIYF